eukprot:GSMAST32.ASY1.ANO1.2021.1 assembled CDS
MSLFENHSAALAAICTAGVAAAAATVYLKENNPESGVRCKKFPKVEAATDTLGISLNEERFLGLMEKLIPCAEFVQNHPPDLVPQEGKVVAILMEKLSNYAPGRSNLIITYPGTEPDQIVSFVGSHLDVVPVNKDEWTKEPFIMTREGDLIYGRGTTDCLGHVAVITDFFCQLAEKQRIDSADSQPCMGTAGALTWHLTVEGKKCHSGMPNQEVRYKYNGPSTMKPTQIRCPPGGLNQIPSKMTISGDIRLTPFYDMNDVVDKIHIKNEKIRSHHSSSRYVLENDGGIGSVSIELEDPKSAPIGVACDIDSRGFAALCSSIKCVKGESKPCTLPLVREMRDNGFDIQITGFGLMQYYHKADEACSFKDMKEATKILSLFVSKVVADMK